MKKISAAQKFPPPPQKNFSNGPSLSSLASHGCGAQEWRHFVKKLASGYLIDKLSSHNRGSTSFICCRWSEQKLVKQLCLFRSRLSCKNRAKVFTTASELGHLIVYTLISAIILYFYALESMFDNIAALTLDI